MCTKEVEVVSLGCANCWDMKNPPAAYTKHLECCGEEYEAQCIGKRFDKITKKFRKYSMITKNLGHCYNEYTCQQCGIQYSVDSSD